MQKIHNNNASFELTNIIIVSLLLLILKQFYLLSYIEDYYMIKS